MATCWICSSYSHCINKIVCIPINYLLCDTSLAPRPRPLHELQLDLHNCPKVVPSSPGQVQQKRPVKDTTSSRNTLPSRFARSLRHSLRPSTLKPSAAAAFAWTRRRKHTTAKEIAANDSTDDFQLVSLEDLAIRIDHIDPTFYANDSDPDFVETSPTSSTDPHTRRHPHRQTDLVDLTLNFPRPPTHIPIVHSDSTYLDLGSTRGPSSHCAADTASSSLGTPGPNPLINRFKVLTRLVRTSLEPSAVGKSASFLARITKSKTS